MPQEHIKSTKNAVFIEVDLKEDLNYVCHISMVFFILPFLHKDTKVLAAN